MNRIERLCAERKKESTGSQLRHHFCSYRENIVDKVIYLLEDYSSHLEDLVRERTEHWIEEKKKTEELLHNMLPKYVSFRNIQAHSIPSIH